MKKSWRRWSLCGLLGCVALAPAIGQAGIIPWPWARRAEPQMTERRAERESFYASRACDPIGARQVYKKGKNWPPYPRPTGPANLPSHLYHAEHYWPFPYACQDRDYVKSLSGAQVSNGWVSMTTLYEYHFDPDTHQLNPSGRMQLRWILENAPQRHRYAFVQSGSDETCSETRIVAVRNEAAQLVGPDLVPPVMLRITSPLGRPADEIDAVRRKDRETMLEPRITKPIGNNDIGASEASGGGN